LIYHFCPQADWTVAQQAGRYTAESLATAGFIHCSSRAQAHLPANALAHGRTDLVLLHIDEDLLPTPAVWEQGDPPHPDGWLFPHVYGPIPLTAVVAVTPFKPTPDGTFAALP
jgi:uncharacterized protein (DUF952 family)